MKRLYLTSFAYEPNEKGKQRIKKIKDTNPEFDKNTKEYFSNLGISPPKDLEESDLETDSEGRFILKDDELSVVSTQVVVNLNNFLMVVDEQKCSTLYLTDGSAIDIVESAFEVDEQINYATQNFFQKIVAQVKNFMYLYRN